jgi:hypothetical protein
MERAPGARATPEDVRVGRALRYALRKARERRRRSLPIEEDPVAVYVLSTEAPADALVDTHTPQVTSLHR